MRTLILIILIVAMLIPTIASAMSWYCEFNYLPPTLARICYNEWLQDQFFYYATYWGPDEPPEFN